MEKAYKLEFQKISKAFPGVLALNEVSFGIYPGCVHVIMGENGAGKSTLMKIINGVHEKTDGVMLLDGKSVNFKSPAEAEKHGIGMIYQELKYLPDFTVERYMMLGREPGKFGCINWKQVSVEAQKILDEAELQYNLKTKLRNLSVSDIQLLEITKVINSANCDIIIMDEPTSALSTDEAEQLFINIEKLKKRGITVIYISHKMDEIFRVADYITVMRDGEHIHTAPASEFTRDSLVTMMVGRAVSDVYPKEIIPLGETVLEVRNLNSDYSGLRDISFKARKGEILGLAGLMGAGRTETVRAIFGLDPITSGEIYVEGKKVSIHSVSDAAAAGIAMATEDRRRYGLVLCRSIMENISLANLKALSKFGFMRLKKEKTETDEISGRLRVKAANGGVKASTLSGGNQQKVVLCKCLLANPKIMILDEPTRGIDVGAKYEIYNLMTEMAKKGICIIMISSELPEFIGMCDRCYTMYNGRITGELQRDEMTQESVMKLIASGKVSTPDMEEKENG